MKAWLVVAPILWCGLMAAPASAAGEGPYMGLSAGLTKADVDQEEVNRTLSGLGLGATTTVEDTDTGFKIYAGYQFTPTFAAELAYTKFGKFTSNSTITSGGSGTAVGEWSGSSIDGSALILVPLGTKFTLFGRAGISVWNLDFDFTATGPGGTASTSESDSGVTPLLGLGATYQFTEKFGVRAEFERHFKVGEEETTGTSDIDMISIGIQLHF